MTASDPRVGEDCATCLGCPDCGTTLSKRTPEAIALRLGKVSDGPWAAWDRGIGYEVHGPHGEPINDRHRETFTRGDAEFIAAAPTDIAYLLAELADRDEKLAKVEALAAAYAPVESQDAVISPDQIRRAMSPTAGAYTWEIAVARLHTAAVAAKAARAEEVRAAQEIAWAKGATSAGVSLMALQAAGINPNPYRKEPAS